MEKRHWRMMAKQGAVRIVGIMSGVCSRCVDGDVNY